MKSGRFLLVLLIPMLTGCGGTKYISRIASYTDPALHYEKTYHITPATADINEDDLEFRQFASYLRNTLNLCGYLERESGAAFLEIRFGYGIGKPDRNSYRDRNGNPYISTVYDRHIELTALHEGKEVWKVKLTSSGSNGNLREVVPYMLVAARDYLGRSAEAVVKIRGGDRNVKLVKGEF